MKQNLHASSSSQNINPVDVVDKKKWRIRGLDLEKKWLGQVGYREALHFQEEQHRRVKAGGHPVLLGLEHPAVVTLGRRGNCEQDLLWSSERMESQGIDSVMTERGGQATLHSPGQLVVYPILPLTKMKIGVRDHCEALLQATVAWLETRGLPSYCDRDRVGIYTERGKIAFLGVRVKSAVSMHGISINIANDLSLFQSIRSCGEEKASLDRLADHEERLETLSKLFDDWSLQYLMRWC